MIFFQPCKNDITNNELNLIDGAVIEDDSQFVLSIGLFSKRSNIPRCEIYVLPPEDGAEFMAKLSENVI